MRMQGQVFKYKLEVADQQTIEMPVGSKILSVAEQHGDICVWAYVPKQYGDKQVLTKKTIFVRGTGHPIDFVAEFIGTVKLQGGALIFHVFEGV